MKAEQKHYSPEALISLFDLKSGGFFILTAWKQKEFQSALRSEKQMVFWLDTFLNKQTKTQNDTKNMLQNSLSSCPV